MDRDSLRAAARLLLLPATVLVLCGAVRAQEGGGDRDPAHGTVIRVNPALIHSKPVEEDLSDRWFRYRNYLANDLHEEAVGEMNELVALQKQARVQRAVEIAEAMVYEGYTYLHRGDLVKARTLFSAAIVLDRYQGEAYAALAWTTLRSDKLALYTFLRDNLLAVRYSFAGHWNSFALRTNLGLALCVAILLALCIFTFLMMLKYGILLHHDLMESRVAKGRESTAWLLFAIAVAAPLLLAFGWWWLGCYWAGLLLLYLSWRERVVTALMLVVAILLPVVFPFYRVLSLGYRDPAVRLLVASEDSADVTALMPELSAYLAQHPEDVDVQFARANCLLRQGHYDDALRAYQKVIVKAPGYQMALTNMGNAFFYLHDYENALKSYRRALEVDPHSATINLNIRAAYSDRFDFSKADTFLRTARAIDPSAVDRLIKDKTLRVISEEFTRKKVWNRIVSGAVSKGLERDEPSAANFFRRQEVLDGLRSAYFPILLLVVVPTAAAALRRRGSESMSCLKCGRPFCKKCQRGVGGDRYCSQCAHIFLLKDGISEEARNRKFSEIQKYARRMGRMMFWTSILLPGSEKLLGDRTLLGFLKLTIWMFLLSPLICRSWFFERTTPFGYYTEQFTTAILIALILLCFAIHAVRTVLNRGRFSDPSEW